jgi:hypothetical protein
MTMVPLVGSHPVNGPIQQDRMLLVSGALSIASASGGKRDAATSSASSALFDGQNFFPYLVASSPSGGGGSISGLISSVTNFSFTQRREWIECDAARARA